MLITDAAVHRRIVVGVLILLIVVAGSSAYVTLPREAEPDVPVPYVLVTTAYEGVAPQDIETAVSIKIENELSGLKGLKEMTSKSAEGVSTVILEFEPDVDIDDALQYVRARVDLAKPELPEEAEEPFIQEINIAEFPIMIVNVSGDISPVHLKAAADDLEEAIEQVPGVLDVEVFGELEREIRLEIDPDRVSAYNMSVGEVMGLIPSENVNISAGGLETEGMKFNVRVPAEFVDPAEVDHLLLTVRDGKPIYLSDVAVVRDTFKDRETYSRLDGLDSITVSVKKRVGANIVTISDAVHAVVAEARGRAPAGVKIEVTMDKAKYVRQMVSDLENNIASGLVLVLGVLILFLGLRTSAIVAVAIPISMLISFALLSALGYTLNFIVLFSLVLALGMLVDNAIVIVENIYRFMQMGRGRVHAAIEGTREVAWPVAASTATTVAAFAPLLFWPGIMGDFMKYLPITLIITLSGSLFVALVISPVVCSFAAAAKKKNQQRDRLMVRVYRAVLKVAVRHRFITLGTSFALLFALVYLYSVAGKGVEFFPNVDPDNAYVNLRSPQGTSIHESDRLARIVEERLEKYRDELDYVVANVGSSGSFGFGGSDGPHSANVTLIFKDYSIRERPSMEVLKEVRADLADIAGAEVKVEKEQEGPPTGDAVSVRFIGKDFSVLQQLSEQGRQSIATVPGLVNLRNDLEAARPELVFRIDRRRARLLNINTALVGRYLKTALFGGKVGTFREYNDEYDITVRFPLEKRINIDDLQSLKVPSISGKPVPLSSLGEFEYEGGFGTITRIDRKRVATLTAANEGRLSTQVLKDVEARLKEMPMPPGYRIQYAGEKEEQDKAAAFLSKAFLYAVMLIVMILVAQFNSLVVPFIILITVLLSMVGVLAGLIICEMPFGIIMTGIGVISLAGVVVNNGIVLLDYTRQLQARGMELVEAVIEAGKTRLRPVLLTATTTILSLIPMATGVSFDFHLSKLEWVTRSQSTEFWRSMATAVIFGLAFATVLTLVVVPALYVTLMRFAVWAGVRKTVKPVDAVALEDQQ